MRRILLALVVSTSLPVLATPALAEVAKVAPAQGPATTSVKSANETIAGLLKQKPAAGSKEEKDLAAKVTTSVRGFLDIDQLGKRAMGDNWSKLSAEQQTEFLTVLRALIEDNYVRGLRANLSYTVAYIGESKDAAGNTVVDTEITASKKGRPIKIKVGYVLLEEKGKYRAWDVKTDGVSLVDNYKTMFDKIIQKDGAKGLIEKMKKKLASGAAAPATKAP